MPLWISKRAAAASPPTFPFAPTGLNGAHCVAVSGAAPVAGGAEPSRFRPLILCVAIRGIATEACLIGLGPSALIRAGVTEVHAAQLLSLFFLAFLVFIIIGIIGVFKLFKALHYILKNNFSYHPYIVWFFTVLFFVIQLYYARGFI